MLIVGTGAIGGTLAARMTGVVKAPAIEAATRPLAGRGMVETYVSLGNGVVDDRISAIVGSERLLVGTVELGATNLGPGHVRQTTMNPFVIGELDGSIRDRTRAVARVLEPVEDVRITDNIAGQLWSKLLVNSALSGLGVVGGCTYGEVAAHPDGREAIFEVWSEIVHGFERGESSPATDLFAHVRRAVSGGAATSRSPAQVGD